MSQQNSGQTNLDEQLDKILDEYENTHNVKFVIFTQDMTFYWNMTRDYIESLSRDDREGISMLLAQQAMYVQRLINRERARVSWCNASLYHICAPEWENYKFWKNDDLKIAAIARENEVAKKLLRIKNHAHIRLLDLEGMPRIIEHLSNVLRSSAYGKE